MTARTSFVRLPATATLLLLLLAGVAPAATWTVARDGSGDFRVLQDAVDAASSGDVIEIGPGRYDEYQTLQFGVLWFDLHVLLPDDMSLTFIGSGAGETIIGPADPDQHVNRTYGIGAIYGVDITVRKLTIENCNMYGIGISTGAVTAEDCRFVFDGAYGTQTKGFDGGFTQGAVVRRCHFEGLFYGFATIDSPAGVLIEDCEFVDCRTGIYAWTPSSSNVTVVDSHFACEMICLSLLQGAGGRLERCTWNNCVLSLSQSGPVEIIGCVATHDDFRVLTLGNGAPITIENSIFQGDGVVIHARSFGGGVIRNNHFLRTGDGFWVECLDGTDYHSDLDLSGNYWGTTDLEEIAAGIWDCHDSDDAYHCVVFEPIADGPVRSEARSWSAIKGLFDAAGGK